MASVVLAKAGLPESAGSLAPAPPKALQPSPSSDPADRRPRGIAGLIGLKQIGEASETPAFLAQARACHSSDAAIANITRPMTTSRIRQAIGLAKTGASSLAPNPSE